METEKCRKVREIKKPAGLAALGYSWATSLGLFEVKENFLRKMPLRTAYDMSVREHRTSIYTRYQCMAGKSIKSSDLYQTRNASSFEKKC